MAKKKVKRAARKAARLDRELTHTAAAQRGHPAMRAAAWLGEVADQPQLIAASLATAAVGAVAGRRDLVRAGARMLAAHLLATAGKATVKHLIDRTRPAEALAHGYRAEPGHSDDHRLNSMPSGHTAGAVAVARALSREVEGAALPAGLATGAVAAVQAPAGHHYWSDVVAGAAIGWAAEALVDALLTRLAPTTPVAAAGSTEVR